MAKVTKEVLKEIVKECLVEILAEGITGGNVESLNESIETHIPQKRQKRSTQSRLMKNILPPKEKIRNEGFEKKLNETISQTTKDPVMAAILADTAKTTLQEQNGADSSNRFAARPTDDASQIVANTDPTELFAESASNWAQLAFSDRNR
jgi:hypothetical protein